MDNWYVADSYKNFKIIGEPFDENGRRYIKIEGTCPRCQGTGNYSYNPRYGTICFKCGGAKKITQKVRAYTEKEYLKLQATKEKNLIKKQEAEAARQRDLIDNAEKYKHEIALKMGFNESEKVYLVKGGNTYEIKDLLKEKGAKFNPILKWFLPFEIELPQPYYLLEISFDDIYDYIPLHKQANLKSNYEKVIAEATGLVSEYYPANEKDRIDEVPATLESVSGFSGMYGYTYIYTFKSNNYVFIWMTAKQFPGIKTGDPIKLTGTIKKFDIYNGIHQTHLTRCSIVK